MKYNFIRPTQLNNLQYIFISPSMIINRYFSLTSKCSVNPHDGVNQDSNEDILNTFHDDIPGLYQYFEQKKESLRTEIINKMDRLSAEAASNSPNGDLDEFSRNMLYQELDRESSKIDAFNEQKSEIANEARNRFTDYDNAVSAFEQSLRNSSNNTSYNSNISTSATDGSSNNNTVSSSHTPYSSDSSDVRNNPISPNITNNPTSSNATGTTASSSVIGNVSNANITLQNSNPNSSNNTQENTRFRQDSSDIHRDDFPPFEPGDD